jgi:hypothetical protein
MRWIPYRIETMTQSFMFFISAFSNVETGEILWTFPEISSPGCDKAKNNLRKIPVAVISEPVRVIGMPVLRLLRDCRQAM